jgi:hypothetical protein
MNHFIKFRVIETEIPPPDHENTLYARVSQGIVKGVATNHSGCACENDFLTTGFRDHFGNVPLLQDANRL